MKTDELDCFQQLWILYGFFSLGGRRHKLRKTFFHRQNYIKIWLHTIYIVNIWFKYLQLIIKLPFIQIGIELIFIIPIHNELINFLQVKSEISCAHQLLNFKFWGCLRSKPWYMTSSHLIIMKTSEKITFFQLKLSIWRLRFYLIIGIFQHLLLASGGHWGYRGHYVCKLEYIGLSISHVEINGLSITRG